jgi:hypothetical protein
MWWKLASGKTTHILNNQLNLRMGKVSWSHDENFLCQFPNAQKILCMLHKTLYKGRFQNTQKISCMIHETLQRQVPKHPKQIFICYMKHDKGKFSLYMLHETLQRQVPKHPKKLFVCYSVIIKVQR